MLLTTSFIATVYYFSSSEANIYEKYNITYYYSFKIAEGNELDYAHLEKYILGLFIVLGWFKLNLN